MGNICELDKKEYFYLQIGIIKGIKKENEATNSNLEKIINIQEKESKKEDANQIENTKEEKKDGDENPISDSSKPSICQEITKNNYNKGEQNNGEKKDNDTDKESKKKFINTIEPEKINYCTPINNEILPKISVKIENPYKKQKSLKKNKLLNSNINENSSTKSKIDNDNIERSELENEIKNNKSREIKNNYDEFNIKKDYYLICPDCNKYIINIKTIEYHSDENDFIVIYKCFCKGNNKKFFYQIISDEQIFCGAHEKELILFCEICNIHICKECTKEHKGHQIKNLINKEIISEEMITKIMEKKDIFNGFDIIQKIFEFYKIDKDSNLNIIQTKGENLEDDGNISKSKVIQNNEEFEQQEKKKSQNINDVKNNNKNEQKNCEEELKTQQEKIQTINYINIKTLKGHEERVTALIKLSNDLIATGSYDKTVKIWDITKNEKDSLIMNKKATGFVLCLLEFEHCKLLGGTNNNLINLWDLEDEQDEESIENFSEHTRYVNALVKCDENYFASASNDAKVIIWDYKNKKCKSKFEAHANCIMSMIMLQNGNLCTADADEIIIIWDWKKLQELYIFRGHEKYVKCLCELDNKYLLTGSEDNTIGIWEEKSQNYENIKYLEGHEFPVRTLCQIKDNYFASGSFDNKIKIWDINTYECVQTLEGHQSNVICIIKDSDNILISSSNDKTIKIWQNKAI